MNEYTREEFERDRMGPSGDENGRRTALLSFCRFCSSPATLACGFMLSEPRMKTAAELRKGDLALSSITLEYHQVGRITGPHADSGMGPYYMVTWDARKRVKDRPELFLASMPVLIVWHEPCGTPACESHAMERGDGKWVCASHWLIKNADDIEPDTAYTPL